MVLDESTSNLDTDSKALIYKILKNNLTIINSTHSPEDFIGFDHHIKIEEGKTGRIVTTKKMKDIYTYYSSKIKLFLKILCTNFTKIKIKN